MSLRNILATGFAPLTFGTSLLGRDDLFNNGYSPSPYTPAKPLLASDVTLANPLKAPLGQINAGGQKSLADALGTLTTGARTSAKASGRVMGGYAGQALGRANTAASRGIEDKVGGVLGGASLQDVKNQREFEANMALANELGSMAKPSMFQEILGGLGGAAQTGGNLYAALGKNTGSRTNVPRASLGGSTLDNSSFDPNAYGYERADQYNPYGYSFDRRY